MAARPTIIYSKISAHLHSPAIMNMAVSVNLQNIKLNILFKCNGALVPIHTLIFYTSMRWTDGLSALSFVLQVDLLLQVGLPFTLQVDSCFRIVVPSLFTYLPSAQILMRTDLR